MVIRVRCPRCWQVAEVPEEALGKQGMCNSCGALVAIPKSLTKVCFICGRDVTEIKHAKDENSNYICSSCWENRRPDEKAVFSEITRECAVCHGYVAPNESFERDGKPVCKACFEISKEFQKEPKPPVETRPEVGSPSLFSEPGKLPDVVKLPPPTTPTGVRWEEPKSTDQAGSRGGAAGVVALVLSIMAILGFLSLFAFQLLRNRWEDDAYAKIVAMRAQAETLVTMGKVREGVAKYNDLLQLVKDRQITNPRLNEEVRLAQKAAQGVSNMIVDNWEDANRTRLMILRAQGDVLVAAGKFRDGVEKYNDFLRLTDPHLIQADDLKEELKAVKSNVVKAMAAWEDDRKTQAAAQESAKALQAQVAQLLQQQTVLAEAITKIRETPVAVMPPVTPVTPNPIASVDPRPPVTPNPLNSGATTRPVTVTNNNNPPVTPVTTTPEERPKKPPLKSIFDW